MNHGKGREAAGYAWAVLAVIAATGLRFLLLPYGKDSVLIYYLLAVVFSVWTGGPRAGILATILGAAGSAIFLGPDLTASWVGNGAGIAAFGLCSLLIIGIFHAQRKAAEDEMAVQVAEEASRARRAELERKDRVALDNTWDVAIIVMDRKRVVREWNAGAAQLTGWSRGEVVGQTIDFLFLPPDVDAGTIRRAFTTAESMGKSPVNRWLVGKAGDQFYGEGMIRPVADDGGWVSGFVMVFIDGTARVQQQDVIEQRMLERANQLESLAYSMAHDMRQYLRSLSNNAKMLERDLRSKLTEDECFALDRLSVNAVKMHEMVEGILEHLRVRTAELNLKPVDLSKVGEEVAEIVHSQSGEAPVHFIVQPGMWVKGDKDLLASVVMNLFENAQKYAGGRVRFGYDPIREAYYVKDEGPGFDPKYAEKIFTPFVRLVGQEKAGTGIGLPNAQRIVERHGGKMWAESEGEGKGATFYFTLKTFEEAPVGALI